MTVGYFPRTGPVQRGVSGVIGAWTRECFIPTPQYRLFYGGNAKAIPNTLRACMQHGRHKYEIFTAVPERLIRFIHNTRVSGGGRKQQSKHDTGGDKPRSEVNEIPYST